MSALPSVLGLLFAPCLREGLHTCDSLPYFSQQCSIFTCYFTLVSLVVVGEVYSLYFWLSLSLLAGTISQGLKDVVSSSSSYSLFPILPLLSLRLGVFPFYSFPPAVVNFHQCPKACFCPFCYTVRLLLYSETGEKGLSRVPWPSFIGCSSLLPHLYLKGHYHRTLTNLFWEHPVEFMEKNTRNWRILQFLQFSRGFATSPWCPVASFLANQLLMRQEGRGQGKTIKRMTQLLRKTR